MPYTDINLLPLGKEMSFAEFIRRDIEANGSFCVFGFMNGERYVVRASRLDESDDAKWWPVKEANDRDDWLFSAGWDFLGYYAHITRGPEKLNFTVRGFEALALLKIQDAHKAKDKAERKAEKDKHKKKLLDARWWP